MSRVYTVRNRLRGLAAALAAAIFAVALASAAGARSDAAPTGFSDRELIDGFMKTVFGLEYRTWNWQPYLVKKYTGNVSFFVRNISGNDRRRDATAFIRSLRSKIRGLSLDFASRPDDANFVVYIVDRNQYEGIVRNEIYGDPAASAPGRCLVRVLSDERGISRSTAVIVADEGEFLFHRCLVEEVLQGLGPMNDNRSLTHSVFNDASRHSEFTVYDRYILNMLYHRRIRPGMTQQQAREVLPSVLRDVRRFVH
ncbi:hypothetical protein GGD81_003215 [Rhodobium orientis]|uniref:DUF2927 domain-containing protein n=1 Tax=Rhodobium orientis TaxID=34017 RepID=A0A327JQQ7_9HYPH|nr:DUF2927 domain-containing protein [Rhodobium orientis]MBB4304159.1 hypothetical protein [Rhodobium orientis]MBK5950630.1 hypothetical protein [Rhodobium orientis]RAI28015.1 hypothetical protein CH339_07880 [Rhodobium orientis]